MIKSITVTNYLNESLKLELQRPDKTGIRVLSVDGIGGAEADIHMTELASSDGGQYNSARLTSRNLVMSLGYMFAPTIEDVRHKVYKYFPIKKRVKLTFETKNRTSEIYGYVESNNPNIFSKEQGSQISIICPDPYFYSKSINLTVFAGAESIFEFPFSNEDTIESLIEVSALRIDQIQSIIYPGDAEIGLTIHIHAVGTVKDISIYNTQTRESMHLIGSRIEELTGEDIKYGDDITISTVKGSKSITLLRDGEYINILNCLDRHSDWFQLTKGDNLILYTAEYGASNLHFTVENRILYEGV